MIIIRLPYFDGEAGGAAGAGGAQAAQGGAQTGAQGGAAHQGGGEGLLSLAQQGNTQQQAAAQDGPKGYWPEGLPEQFAKLRGVDDKSTIELLTKEVSGFERAPENAAGYKLELPKEIAAKLPDLEKDPAFAVYRDIALEAGLSNKQFSNTIGKFYAALAEKGLLPDTVNAKAELGKLMPEKGTQAEREATAMQRLQSVTNQVAGLVANKTLSEAEAGSLRGLAATAQGVTALEKVFKSMGEHGLQGGGKGVGSATKESLAAEMQDPCYDTRGPKYDKNFRARVDADWRRMHG